MKNLSWYSEQTAEDFFPRCFKLSHEDDKMAFIEDYRLTSCISLLKYIIMKHRGEPEDDLNVHITSAEELKKLTDQVEGSATSENNSDPASNLNISPIDATNNTNTRNNNAQTNANANTSNSSNTTTVNQSNGYTISNNNNINTPRPNQSNGSPRASFSRNSF